MWRLRIRPTLAKDILISYVSVISFVAAKRLVAKRIAAKMRLGTLSFRVTLQWPGFESSTLYCKLIVTVCVWIIQLLCLISVAVLPSVFVFRESLKTDNDLREPGLYVGRKGVTLKCNQARSHVVKFRGEEFCFYYMFEINSMKRFLDTTEFKDTKTFSGACHRMPTLTTGLSATRQKRTFLLVIYQFAAA